MSYNFSIFLKDYASSSLAKIAGGVGNLENKVNSLSGKTKTAEKDIADLGNTSSSTGGKLNGLVGIASRLFVAFGAFETIKSLFNIGVQAEQANTKFEVLLGSAEKGAKMLSDLTKYADQTPYSFSGIQKGAETMLGFGIAQDKVLPSMKMLGDVAMGNDEKLSSLSLVYSQIMATGKLMGQDLLQLINSGFNPLQVISEKTGISMGVLKEQMEKGQISSGMVAEAFRIATSEGGRYYGMTEKMAETAGGKWSTMMDAFSNVTKKVGLRFAEWIKPLFDIGTAFAEKIIPFGKWVMDILPSMSTFVLFLKIAGVSALITAGYFVLLNYQMYVWAAQMAIGYARTLLMAQGQAILNAVMNMNPIGLVVIAILALSAAVVYAWNRFGWFRGGVLGVWSVLKGLADTVKNYVVARFKELLSVIGNIAQAWDAIKNGNFSGAFDAVKNAGKNLLGVDSGKAAFAAGQKVFQSFNSGYDEGMKSFVPKTATKVSKSAPKSSASPVKSTIFDSLLGESSKGVKGIGKGKNNGTENNPVKERADGIVSGGSKQTQINITIGKLQDQTVIHVDNTEKGLSGLGDKVQEILLRAVNSVNQMQTS